MQNEKPSDNLKTIYESIREVFCPYLNQKVVFNSKGYRHLFYKKGSKERSYGDVKFRMSLLDTGRNILSITTTIQEVETRNKDKVTENFFGFIAIVNEIKIKIIVRKINENGSYHFYSLIPHYVTSLKRDLYLKEKIPS